MMFMTATENKLKLTIVAKVTYCLRHELHGREKKSALFYFILEDHHQPMQKPQSLIWGWH